MGHPITHKLSFSRIMLLAVAAITALAASLALDVVHEAAGQAQAPRTSEARPAFEVATIKPFDPGAGPGRPGMFQNFGPPCGFTGLQIDQKRIALTAYPYTLIQLAYGEKGSNCRVPELLSGGPEWIRSDRYDVEAVIPEGTPTYTLGQFANREAPRLQMMFQTLLEDRFKLKLHREMKEVQAYVLTVGKGTPKFTPASESDQPVRGLRRLLENGQPYGVLTANKATMADLATMLAGAIGTTQVVDKTGLTGQFNVTFEFDANGVARPTIATALQEIGLKLETTKVAKEALVIDSVEKPSDN